MSSTDTTKHDEDNNNIDTITEDIERVIISEDKMDTDKNRTSCEQNNNTEGDSVAINDKSICASCGKEGNSDDMNTCNKCKSVKYCNAACKKKHRTKHKKACERRVAELHDEQLFKDPPPPEECPICFLILPIDEDEAYTTYKSCCGKRICNGCMLSMVMCEDGGPEGCPFCRVPRMASDEEHIKQTNWLMDKGDANAMNHLAWCHSKGNRGVPQDHQKANELFLKAGELGCAKAYYNLGVAHEEGSGVEINVKKAMHFYELAAIGGDRSARFNLGLLEGEAGNYDRSLKHFMLAARAGHTRSLDLVKQALWMVRKGIRKG